MLFVTAGDPSLAELPAILDALAEGGADVIELGFPFSDPIADGPTIQASSQRALESGVTPDQIFDLLTKSPRRDGPPMIMMGYLNPVLRKGYPQFATLLSQAGFSGALISDLTPEESEPWCLAAKSAEQDTVFLVAPTSTDERIAAVCERASGFVYAVSRTGVTGSESSVPTDVSGLVSRIKQKTKLPVCVGFGISTPDQVRAVCQSADGAVIGSSLVKLLAEKWQGGKGRAEIVAIVRELKLATL